MTDFMVRMSSGTDGAATWPEASNILNYVEHESMQNSSVTHIFLPLSLQQPCFDNERDLVGWSISHNCVIIATAAVNGDLLLHAIQERFSSNSCRQEDIDIVKNLQIVGHFVNNSAEIKDVDHSNRTNLSQSFFDADKPKIRTHRHIKISTYVKEGRRKLIVSCENDQTDEQHRFMLFFFSPPKYNLLQEYSLCPLSSYLLVDDIDNRNIRKRSGKFNSVGTFDIQASMNLHTFGTQSLKNVGIDIVRVLLLINCSSFVTSYYDRNCVPGDNHGAKRKIKQILNSLSSALVEPLDALRQSIRHKIDPLKLVQVQKLARFFKNLNVYRQIAVRGQQMNQWLDQYNILTTSRPGLTGCTLYHATYNSFYNSLWLVVNDVIFGLAISGFISENMDWLSVLICKYSNAYAINGLSRTIWWLTTWPAGLKLNNELALFYNSLCQYTILIWSNITVFLAKHMLETLKVISIVSPAGSSFGISLFADLWTLLTLHIHILYLASAKIYKVQLTILISLFHLFRGKKRNVLRKRIDSADFSMDQLYLGTLLFTLLIFLFPTTMAFYYTFATVRVAVLIVTLVLQTIVASLNQFPLFYLMLRCKDSFRIPGSISIELSDDGDPDQPTALLRSQPTSLKYIFHPYVRLFRYLRYKFFSLDVAWSILHGRVIICPTENELDWQY